MSAKLPDHIDGLVKYLSSSDEKANEDLILKYFRKTFGDDFSRQKEAEGSDGYLPGHFVLELKGKTNDWLAGLFQGIAYRKNLNFGVVVVAANGFLAMWSIDDLDDDLVTEVLSERGAPNAIGKRLSQRHKSKKSSLMKKAAYQFPAEYVGGLFQGSASVILKEVDAFEKCLNKRKKVRNKVTTKNFTAVLKQMTEYFDSKKPIKVVRAFYSMIFGWTESSVLEISSKNPEHATLGGELIENLVPGKRDQFKKFVESHYMHLEENENVDDFFSKYDLALDAVDKNFRIKNGIFFTDLDLSRFAMWFVRKQLGDIGKNYLVIDPACGSGNLVTNWRSPMELRHKVVSEIEPELLYTVEQRMKGDKWHNGKYTVVPKVSENIGLNFLDKSAEEYIAILKRYLHEKGQKADKPIAFLCNPPYRSDEDQSAESIGYEVDQSIVDIIGLDAAAERACCFLAQMKRISEVAESNGLPGDSLLLLFTGTSWLSQRPVYEKIRKEIFGNFEDVSGMLVTSNEFFEVSGKFPIAFTVWRYKGPNAGLDATRPIELFDLTELKKADLEKIDWNDDGVSSKQCDQILASSKDLKVRLGLDIPNIKEWSGLKSSDFKRERRKEEKELLTAGGLPKGDRRLTNKKTYGESAGEYIGFMDDLTPCRIKNPNTGGVWFYLDNRFMRVRTNRCFSGGPDNRGHYVANAKDAEKAFAWFAVARTFADLGYPTWANASELWPIVPPKQLMKRLNKFAFAIGYAENECVEVTFPAANPVKAAKEISVSNPLTPLDSKSFWSSQMATYFSTEEDGPEDRLVVATSAIFKEWKKRFAGKKEIYVGYERAYFVGDGILRLGAGLVQIFDYAKESSDEKLLALFEEMNSILRETKEAFKKLLHQKSGFNYFDLDEERLKGSLPVQISAVPSAIAAKGFDHVVELRLALACKIVNELNDTKDFGRVKFAKVFYMADVMSGVDLKTDYAREAAGPLDQRSLYNDKIGIEPLAARRGLFSSQKKKGKEFDFVQYTQGSNLQSGLDQFNALFGKRSENIDRILKLLAPMNRDQVEIVATLYACWNDLLLAKKNTSDLDLIKEFRQKWHPEKSLKFEGKKPRFSEKKLTAAIQWMKQKKLVPSGTGKKTQNKPAKHEVIPF